MRLRPAIAVFTALSVLSACEDTTAPMHRRPPGTVMVKGGEYAQWMWVQSTSEILYSTPFEYPYAGPGTSLKAVGMDGRQRTVVAPFSGGNQIVGYRFSVQGAHVYFEVSDTHGAITPYRARLDGSSAPEQVLPFGTFGMTVSPDERTAAWIGGTRELVLVDIATKTRTTFALQAEAQRVLWSPSGRTLFMDYPGAWAAIGTPFQWMDLTAGTPQLWRAPMADVTAESSSDMSWNGEDPQLYVVGPSIVRFDLKSGSRTLLAQQGGDFVAGWSSDHSVAFIGTESCLDYSSGPFGGDCLEWRSAVDRLVVSSGSRTNVLRFDGAGQLFARLSPTGAWLAYSYSSCGGGCTTEVDGLYVLAIR